MNNEEIKPFLKEKLYKETLNQLAKTMPSYKDDDVLATTWEDANTELYVIEVEDIKNAINFAINKTYAEARSNTAKEIFKELAKICRQQIEPAQLERFAKEFFDAKDESEAFAIAQKFSKIVFYADEYKAVKNKWVE